jgi:very-short-patch-repair endonuclease
MSDDYWTEMDADWYRNLFDDLRDPNRKPTYPPSACFDEGERRNLLRRQAESPIESKLMVSLMDSWKFVPVAHEDVGYQLPRFEIAIVAQYPVWNYRIDLGLFFHTEAGQPIRVALECDGKLYHEGAENERRDAVRDSRLEAAGFQVWRYPGWLLHHHPHVAANEIHDAANALMMGQKPVQTFMRQRAGKTPTIDELTKAYWAFGDGVPWPPRMGKNPRERGWRSVDHMFEWAYYEGRDEFPGLIDDSEDAA